MKKVLSLMIFGLFVISMIGVASANGGNNVIVIGKILSEDGALEIEGATVTVTCNGFVEVDTSDIDGDYAVEFDGTECATGNTVSIVAVKNDLSGFEEEVVKDFGLSVNIVVVDVPLTPEFGFLMGIFTLMSAVGIFFFVRRD